MRSHPALDMIALALLVCACEPNNQGYAPRQPIVYSHAVHAGALGIDCQYCHYGAERGRYAGIPPAAICMNCHAHVAQDHPEVAKVRSALETDTPIKWVRVHRVPDHVYFDHSAHVAAKVECQTCHGPVESMGLVKQFSTLNMGWCVNCHRDNHKEVLPEGLPARAIALTDCAKCHR